jgi:hypothetical protein
VNETSRTGLKPSTLDAIGFGLENENVSEEIATSLGMRRVGFK